MYMYDCSAQISKCCLQTSLFKLCINKYLLNFTNKVEVEVELSLEHKLLNVIGAARNILQPAEQRNRSFK